ncbi:hypothetical protein T260_09755 [Geobacillus thermopakistaniensis]|uniref:Uncharacterized protein n=1 Tax=Geobacillus thermopakistaniensis (strain MAS1) TaxID=1408282 RepID=A0A7U9JB19_GEOTM|nr:hypothetical protein T260_09755 [Geobacillus sp. MAS1]
MLLFCKVPLLRTGLSLLFQGCSAGLAEKSARFPLA